MRSVTLAALLCALVLAAPASRAQMSDAEVEAVLDSLTATLDFRQGPVQVGDGIATLNVPPSFRFLGPEDAATVLEAWGNPPGYGALGMLFPAEVSPFDSMSWGVIVSFEGDGYVEDGDAAEIDYDALLSDMQAGAVEENRMRTEQGYPTIDIIGWADRPRYDADTHKLVWARELAFGGEPLHTLNYDVRVLGRRGVLSFNAVAAMDQLPMVQDRMQEVMAFSDFNAGHRYEDFDESVDEVAAYGIGALVAGGVLAKSGFFKVLLLGALKLWKLGLLAVVAGAAGLRRFLARRRGVVEPDADPIA